MQEIIIVSPYHNRQQLRDEGYTVIDATSHNRSLIMRWLSPFNLRPVRYPNIIFENLWQYSKMYSVHGQFDPTGNFTNVEVPGFPNELLNLKETRITKEFLTWANEGMRHERADRYPMGKGAKPVCSIKYIGGKYYFLDYIAARKLIYAPEYAWAVVKTEAYKMLQTINGPIAFLDYDYTDFRKPFKDIINDPTRRMGHATVLAGLLTGQYNPNI